MSEEEAGRRWGQEGRSEVSTAGVVLRKGIQLQRYQPEHPVRQLGSPGSALWAGKGQTPEVPAKLGLR